MSSRKKGNSAAIIVSSSDLNVGQAANENIPEAQIRDSLAENERRLKQGDVPIRKQLAFWRSFSVTQVRNAQFIYAGFQRLYAGSGVRTQNYSFMPRAQTGYSERSTSAEELFSKWARKGWGIDISVTAILEVLVFGYSCREIDQRHQKRKGFAKQNLIAGLELYEELRQQHTKLEKTT